MAAHRQEACVPLPSRICGLERVAGCGIIAPWRNNSARLIGRGAPLAYRTTSISVLCLFSSDGGLEDVLVADGADSAIVDLDRIK
jgi:hypothetical protein